MLTVIGPPFDVSFLAWVALAPFVIGCVINDKVRTTVLAAYIISLLYWLGNLYWLIRITVPGGIAFCIYIAMYWPILAICLRYCARREIAMWISLPILIVGAETFQGLIFRGFGWRYLGHSQYANISIIQIADIFGAAGVSFLVAMVNGLVAEIILSRQSTKTQRINNYIGVVFIVLAIGATLLYGRYRINQKDVFEDGPLVGVVQSNVAVEASEEVEPGEITFLNMLVDSRHCMAEAEPSLIIWPETMVEGILDESYLRIAGEDDNSEIFHKALIRHSNEGVYLLVGAFSGDAEKTGDEIKMKTEYNTAFLYEPNGFERRQQYSKIHLVPFGEYIPFIDSLPFLYKYLMMLTPYDSDYTLNAGSEYTVFKMPVQNKIYHFGVLICYEDTVPIIGRKLTLDKDKNKQIDWLVNISNDGWFVRQCGGLTKATTELGQHTAICVFRAVENRVPIIRSVNTGISCYIDSLGKIHNDYVRGTLSKGAFDRTCERGWFADRIVTDRRITFFSKYGQLLEIVCAICFTLAVFLSIYKLTVNKRIES